MVERREIGEQELATVIEHVKHNTVPIVEGRKCVDGRYRNDQRNGMIARPGGDFGYVMALMAVNKKLQLGLTPEQCFEKVFDILTKEEENQFHMHTDHHADPDEKQAHEEQHDDTPLIGCGHIAKASNENLSSLYGIDAVDLQKLVTTARMRKEQGAKIDMVNLIGEHEDKGVLVVESDEKTIDSFDEKRNTMYFVYDKGRDEAFMKNLVEKLAISGLTYDEFKEASDTQLQATLQLLAAGLPIFNVELKEQMKVSMSGRIEPLED